MNTSLTQTTPSIRLRRSRLLPVAGVVLVRQGQKVNSGDVVAEASLPSRHALIDVVRVLGLSGPKAAEAIIQRKAGETLGENDIIAETGGLFSRVIRTPAPGKIISIRDGQVLIETQSNALSLKANYSGIIAEVINDRGVVIETTGALIQGAWGNGKSAIGPLLCKAESKTTELTSASLEVTARGAIIAGGCLNNPEIFSMAATLPVAGLIVGTLPAALRVEALAQEYPILVIDGFGQSGLNHPAWKLLSVYNNREVTLNAVLWNHQTSERPEALIALPAEDEVAKEPQRFTSGQLVRIHSHPFLGQTGVIEKQLPGLTMLPNGLRVAAASIIMDNKERKIIPLANLDGIGFTN